EPADLSAAVRFLAGDGARHITGATLDVNGGHGVGWGGGGLFGGGGFEAPGVFFPVGRFPRCVAPPESRGAGRDPAARAEPGARRTDYVSLVQELVEEIPGAQAARHLHPDVRSVAPTVRGEADGLHAAANDRGVVHVVVDLTAHLPSPFVGVHPGSGALDD